MQIYPAIDLRGGQCVRLKQGDYAQETVFGADPAEMARRWVNEGATYLHIVDLDGAKDGKPVNGPSIRAIVKASGVPCQLGGGLRTEEQIKEALAHADRNVSGTYSFHVESADRTGGTNIEQGGAFSAAPGKPATLGVVTLGAKGADYDAKLEVTVGGESIGCAERIGSAT